MLHKVMARQTHYANYSMRSDSKAKIKIAIHNNSRINRMLIIRLKQQISHKRYLLIEM